MKYTASDFTFQAPPVVARARRILIKPSAGSSSSYPVSTSRGMMSNIIEGIRKVSDADIIILDGTVDGSSVMPIYKTLGYDFARVLLLDVKDCVWVEVDNPLPKPLAMPTFWIPNVILSSDYLISVTPLKEVKGHGWLSIKNLLSLLPSKKYGGGRTGWRDLYALGIDRVIADLYFTLPFDLGIIEAQQKLVTEDMNEEGQTEKVGEVFLGEPFQVDREVSETTGVKADYLNLIRLAESGLDII